VQRFVIGHYMRAPNESSFKLFEHMCNMVDLYTANADMSEDGNGLTLYSWEPFAKQKNALKSVVEWCNQNLGGTHSWRVQLFCRDGFLQCSAHGEELDEDEDDEPISGTSVFDQ
jgi:hypothetical protein